ncbi:MAG: arsenate reductase ArsC [Candidatus Coatesbacteria bacterium]|nr:arsenate reductase ArsC [Candidatus Coatesbacteria bacterium]
MHPNANLLFLCGSNSCRSQMAEGILRSLAGDRFDVKSAGASASYVHPMAIRVMDEIGIDISNQRSKSLDEFIGQRFDYVITVCANDRKSICPFFPGKIGQRISWGFEDPADADGDEDERLAVFRRVRDGLIQNIKQFLQTHPN